jgi:hypothetical protein
MLTQTRHAHVVFEHDDAFRGEVRIVRGDTCVTVSVESLRAFVAESVRYELAAHIARMKPADLLRRLA